MSIVDQIKNDVKQAMRDKNKQLLTTLRSLSAEFKQIEIDTREDITEEQVLSILAKGIKTRQESEKQYSDANREDLAEIERSEIAIYQNYLPEQLSEAEIEAIVDEAIAQTGATSPKDMGKVMGALMNKVKGKADGGVVSSIVKSKLVG